MLYLHLGLNTLKGGDKASKIEAGLPNIIGFITNINTNTYGTPSASGAFYFTDKAKGSYGYGDEQKLTLHFDASRANPIYGARDTVQPPAISLIPQIKF